MQELKQLIDQFASLWPILLVKRCSTLAVNRETSREKTGNASDVEILQKTFDRMK